MSAPSTKRFLFVIPIAVVFLLVLFDFGLRALVESSDLLLDSVDLHSPAVLYAKVLHLKASRGTTIALLGDSSVAGGVMQEFGETTWRDHTVSRELQRELQDAGVDRPQVLNVAMNAAQAAETRKVTEAVLTAHPHLVMIELTLDTFVSRGGKTEIHYNRPWLKTVSLSEDGRLTHLDEEGSGWAQRYNEAADSFLLRYWYAYRVRDFLQWRFLNGPPSEAIDRNATFVDNRLGLHAPINIWGGGDAAWNLQKGKRDYANLNLEDQSPQILELKKTLQTLKDRGQKAIIFYMPENAALRDSLMPPTAYQASRAQLRSYFAPFESSKIRVIWETTAPPPEDYHDQAHFNVKGAEPFVRQNLLQAVVEMLKVNQ